MRQPDDGSDRPDCCAAVFRFSNTWPPVRMLPEVMACRNSGLDFISAAMLAALLQMLLPSDKLLHKLICHFKHVLAMKRVFQRCER